MKDGVFQPLEVEILVAAGAVAPLEGAVGLDHLGPML
jgi:hypothetical protein